VTRAGSARSHLTAAVLAWGSVVSSTIPALAQSAEPWKVELAVSHCPPEFESELRRLLALELGESFPVESGPVPRESPAEADTLRLTCEGEVTRIEAGSRGQAEPAFSELRWDAFPRDSVPRAVVLAAIEALAAASPVFSERLKAARSRRETPAEPKSKTATPPVVVHPEPAAPKRPALWLGLGPQVQYFTGGPGALAWGLRLDFTFRVSAPLELGLALDGTWARREVELGALQATLFSGAAWAAFRLERATWVAAFGAGVRAGMASLRGEPASYAVVGHETTQPWLGPLLVARVDRPRNAFGVGFVLEAGAFALGTEGLAGGQPALVLRGVWLSAGLSAKIGL